ncbi:hypothetical protein ASC94_10115 [Massilia sp. Root418]|uniref:DUF3168 domain-containing protein n=1 Tax=Massilia sp. Root418 TaxID=1736532 RepID=UPI0006FB9589|nr:DUF3168 domain-containing protein [Massilia sp. Root418]KQW97136.1 hypothetical protein ASC94_10115 [Massilia sp. Root418]
MSLEPQIFDALKHLVADQVYPDIGPDGVQPPYITYQQVGGDAVNYTEAALPGKRNARIQVNVWAATRLAASDLADQVEDAMRLTEALQTTVVGSRVSDYEPATKLRGTRQDFSVWY